MISLSKLNKSQLVQMALQLNKHTSQDKIKFVRSLQKSELIRQIIIRFDRYNLHHFAEAYLNNTNFIDVSLANTYNPDKKYNYNDFYVSEKYDGYRAYLKDGVFRTREKLTLQSLRSFSEAISVKLSQCTSKKNIILDGELWFGRGTFHTHASSLNSKIVPDYILDTVIFKVFDYVSDEPYHERYRNLKRLIDCISMDSVSLVEQSKVKDREELYTMLKKVVDMGGEGLMLRNKNQPYIHKRSNALLKLKPTKFKQMMIVGYKMGNGKYKTMLGSLVVADPQKHENLNHEILPEELTVTEKKKFTFVSGMDDESRLDYKRRFPLGRCITVAYTELTDDGNLRHPRIAYKH